MMPGDTILTYASRARWIEVSDAGEGTFRKRDAEAAKPV
jgi:hypothetical protein